MKQELDLTVSFVGASISSIIMLSRAKELRLRVLDLSELKERRLYVTTQPSAAGNNKWRAGEHDIKQKARNPLLHATSREPDFTLLDRESPKWKSRKQKKAEEPVVELGLDISRLFRDGNKSEVSFVCTNW